MASPCLPRPLTGISQARAVCCVLCGSRMGVLGVGSELGSRHFPFLRYDSLPVKWGSDEEEAASGRGVGGAAACLSTVQRPGGFPGSSPGAPSSAAACHPQSQTATFRGRALGVSESCCRSCLRAGVVGPSAARCITELFASSRAGVWRGACSCSWVQGWRGPGAPRW